MTPEFFQMFLVGCVIVFAVWGFSFCVKVYRRRG